MELAILIIQLLLGVGTAFVFWQLNRYIKAIPEDDTMEPHMPYIQPRLNAIMVNIGIFVALYIPRIVSLVAELIKIITEQTA